MPSIAHRSRRRFAAPDDESQHRHRSRRDEEDEQEEEEEEYEEAEEDGDDGEDEYEDGGSNRRRSQKRKRKGKGRQGDDNNDDDDDDNDDDNDDEDDGQQPDRQQLYHELLAKKLVRYALASEPRRLPIRRQAVKEQVLEKQGKNFRKVFPLAQDQLRGIFGMEMVEWPARDEATMSVRERRKALKTQKTPTAASAAAAARADRFVLVSTLPDDYRAAVFASLSSKESATPSSTAPDAAFTGFCTLVIALITLSGGALDHADLEKYLTMLYGARQGPVRADAELLPVASALGDFVDDDDNTGGGSHDNDPDTSSGGGGTLQHLVRQGYVVRVVEASMTAEGRGPVGGRGTGGGGGAGGSSGAKVTWHVGPRGRLEVGPAEVAAVVRHIYGPDAAGPGLERRLRSSLRTIKDRENGVAAEEDEEETEVQEAGN